jgi:sentrin-specific protease 7
LSGGVNRARIAATLRGWLYEEYRAKHNGSTKDFSKSVMKSGLIRVPQQGNYYDCGLFVMHFFEKFFEASKFTLM